MIISSWTTAVSLISVDKLKALSVDIFFQGTFMGTGWDIHIHYLLTLFQM